MTATASKGTEAAAARVRELNEQVLDFGKKAGLQFLEAYEANAKTYAEQQDKFADTAQVEWLATAARARPTSPARSRASTPRRRATCSSNTHSGGRPVDFRAARSSCVYVLDRSLHVHVPRRLHRRAQRGTRQRARRRRAPPARVGFAGADVDLKLISGRAGVNGQVVDEFMATGAVVAGRGTFEPAGGWGGDHHDGVPIFILVRREPHGEMRDWPLVTYVSDVRTAMTEAKRAAGDKNVLVHGAGIAQLALAAGVLDEIEIHLVPVLLGQGRRLFDNLSPEHIELERTRVLEGEAGTTHLHYRVRASRRHSSTSCGIVQCRRQPQQQPERLGHVRRRDQARAARRRTR